MKRKVNEADILESSVGKQVVRFMIFDYLLVLSPLLRRNTYHKIQAAPRQSIQTSLMLCRGLFCIRQSTSEGLLGAANTLFRGGIPLPNHLFSVLPSKNWFFVLPSGIKPPSLQMKSRCSKLFYSIHAGENLSDIALPYSFAPTSAFHQSRSPLRSFFKTAVGTK